MCRTVHSILGTIICGLQMLVRVMMTIILMMENLIRMFLQTFYNFISFMLQMISLVPICLVFLITSRLKCFMCGGGGPCPVNRGGTCDCLMSAVAIIILFFIFRATGLLDKIFYKIGYAKATPEPFTRFVPTPGDITECSRESNDTDEDYDTSTPIQSTPTILDPDVSITTTHKSTANKNTTTHKTPPLKPTPNETTTYKPTATHKLTTTKPKTTLKTTTTAPPVLRENVDSGSELESEDNDEEEEKPETEPTTTTLEPTTLPLTLPTTPPGLSMFDNMWTTIIYYIE